MWQCSPVATPCQCLVPARRCQRPSWTPVLVHDRREPVPDAQGEPARDPRIGVVQRVARALDVGVAQADRRDAVPAPQSVRQELDGVLGDAVRGVGRDRLLVDEQRLHLAATGGAAHFPLPRAELLHRTQAGPDGAMGVTFVPPFPGDRLRGGEHQLSCRGSTPIRDGQLEHERGALRVHVNEGAEIGHVVLGRRQMKHVQRARRRHGW